MSQRTARLQYKAYHEASIGAACVRLAVLVSAGFISCAALAETNAGDRIVNTAGLRYQIDGTEQSVSSNTDNRIVDERLDVALERSSSGPVAAASGAIPVLLTNRGNGMEAFRLSASDDVGAPPTVFAIDIDADGRFDPAIDTLLPNSVTPILAPGATMRLLLIDDKASRLDGTSTTILVRAVTGFGAPGTDFPGLGDGGGDAITGPTGAQAQVVVPMIGQETPPTLSKAQGVRARDGSARAVRGAVITYTLSAAFAGPALGARIDDPVPAGTAYVPGSLTLDGAPLTDAADGDAGTADGRTIGAALGDVAVAGVRTLQFKVLIQ